MIGATGARAGVIARTEREEGEGKALGGLS